MTEKTETTLEPELDPALGALIKAAAIFAHGATAHYAEREPESAEAYGALFLAGKIAPGVRVRLGPPHVVEVGFVGADDGWHPVLAITTSLKVVDLH